MALSPGSRLGPYEILAAIGAGGMGEVYRAHDAKLHRDVAIKVLLPAVANDPDRLARFSREAQVLASLNHPNIAAIYGLEESDGVRALVMELVEGPTLAERIAQGAIPLDEALPIARQIAEALEAAHEQGIIHRDLKPANIKVRPDGTVKVLDFGLAKAIDQAASRRPQADLANSPTLSIHATEAGLILGTAAYMSPEQAAGKVVDQRTDLWAFGVVLMEMLTGRRVFDGETVSHVLAAVLKDDPDWTALPPTTPASIRRLLRRCLEKDRKCRLPDAADARLEIDDAPLAASGDGSRVAVPVSRPAWRRALPVLAVALVALAAGTAATWLAMRASPTSPAVVRMTMTPRPGEVVGTTFPDPDLAVSLDGRRLVYVGTAGGQPQLFVRALDQLEPTQLRGLTNPRTPFLSPDGAWVGFFEGQTLKKVAITGGPALTLCPITGGPRGASWGPGDTVIFATNAPDTGLLEVSAGGGEPRVLTRPDPAKGEVDHLFPEILPGGEAVLFTILATGPIENSQVAVLDLRTGQSRVLVQGGSNPHYAASGHLVYGVGGTLRAVAFDLDRLQVRGTPVPVVERVVMKTISGAANFSLARDGSLVYLAGDPQGARTLVWVDRQGREDPIPAPPRNYVIPRLSPDGRRVALDVRDQENDIWIWAFAGQTLTRLTFDPSLDQFPVWTPNGARVVFSSGSPANLFWRAADGTGAAERLAEAPTEMLGHSFSPDGTRLVVRQLNPKTGFDLSLLLSLPSLAGGPGRGPTRDARPLLATPFNELNAEVSPDGAWLAYQSNASGIDEIYVRPFPDVEQGRWQVSTGGGRTPLWARRGRELFYLAPDGKLMAVPIQPGPSFTRGNAAVVVDRVYFSAAVGRSHDVSPDGTRFLMIKDAAASTATQLVVVLNFFEELKRLVPAQ